MPTFHAPDDVRDQATPIIKIFTETADLKVKVNGVAYNGASITALNDDVGAADKAVEDKRAELIPLINARNDKAGLLNKVLVQARKAIFGYFGEDSSEYELAGGTRTSERKSPGRKKSKPAAPATA